MSRFFVQNVSSTHLLTSSNRFSLNICIFVFVFRFAFFVFFRLPPHQSLSTQCNVTCGGGDGYRTGERVCMRLFPKSADNPHPVKTGRKVDAKNCAHVKIPPAKKLVRKCKPCQFRWEVSPWSKVGVFVSLTRTSRVILLSLVGSMNSRRTDHGQLA